MDGRLLEIGEIHRDLSQAAHEETCSLDEAHSATRKAHSLGDSLRDVDVGRIQEDVVRDKKFAGANNGRASRWMDPRFSKIWLTRRVGRDIIADAFKLPASDVLKILPFRRSRCCFI